MSLESMMLYTCPVCGNTMAGLEWEDTHSKYIGEKDFICSSCGHDLNEDELQPKE